MERERGVGYESGSSDGAATPRLLARRREGSDDDGSLRGGDRAGFGDESEDEGRAPDQEEEGGAGSDVEGEGEEEEKVLACSEVVERRGDRVEEVWVPRYGAFYMHDDRSVGRGRRGGQCRRGVRTKDFWEAGDGTKWQHDKYEEIQKWENEEHLVSTNAARRCDGYLHNYSKNADKEESDHENQALRVVRGRGPIKYNPHECTRIGGPQIVNKYQEPHAMAANSGSNKGLGSGSHVNSAPSIHYFPGSFRSKTSALRENRCFMPPSSALLQGNPLSASFVPDNGRSIHSNQSVSMTLQSSQHAQWSEPTTEPPSAATPNHIIEDIHLRSAVRPASLYNSQPSSPAASVLDPGLVNTFHVLNLARGACADNRSVIVHDHETAMDSTGQHSGHHSVDRTLIGCMNGPLAHFGRGNSVMPWPPFTTNSNLGPCCLPYSAHSTGCMQSFDVDGSPRDEVLDRRTSRGRTTSGARAANNGYGQRSMKPTRYSQMNFHDFGD